MTLSNDVINKKIEEDKPSEVSKLVRDKLRRNGSGNGKKIIDEEVRYLDAVLTGHLLDDNSFATPLHMKDVSERYAELLIEGKVKDAIEGEVIGGYPYQWLNFVAFHAYRIAPWKNKELHDLRVKVYEEMAGQDIKTRDED